MITRRATLAMLAGTSMASVARAQPAPTRLRISTASPPATSWPRRSTS